MISKFLEKELDPISWHPMGFDNLAAVAFQSTPLNSLVFPKEMLALVNWSLRYVFCRI